MLRQIVLSGLKVRDIFTRLTPGPFFLSIAGGIAGNFLLRASSSAAATILSLYLASIYVRHASIRVTFLGTLAVVFYAAELTGAPLFGSLSDRFGRKAFMWLGTLFGAAGTLVLTFPPVILIFVVARVAQGLSAASSVPAVLGYLAAATAHSTELRGRVMVAFEVGTIMGFALGFAAGGVLWDRLQVAGFYWIFLAYVLAMGAFALVHSGRQVQLAAVNWRFYGTLLRHGPTLRFVPAWVAVNGILGMWFIHLGFQMAKADNPAQLLAGGYSGSAIGLVFASVSVVFVVGTAAWALAFGRVPATKIMAGTLMALAFFTVILYGLNHSPEGSTFRISLFIIAGVFTLLIASGFTPAALTYLAEISEHFPSHRGSLMGLYSVFLGVGQLLGGWLGGFFAQAWQIDGLILATALLGLMAHTSLFLMVRASAGGGAGAEKGRSPPAGGRVPFL